MAKCHRMESYMSDYKNVLKKCADMGIDLWTENGKLKYKASTNTLSQDILRRIEKKYKGTDYRVSGKRESGFDY